MSDTATTTEPLVGMTARVTEPMKRRIKSAASLAGKTADKWLAEAAAEKLAREQSPQPQNQTSAGE